MVTISKRLFLRLSVTAIVMAVLFAFTDVAEAASARHATPAVKTGKSGKKAKLQHSDEPDFAYPAEVKADSKKRLTKALDAHNDPDALRAALDLYLAMTAVTSDNLPEALDMMENTRNRLATDAGRAMADLLLANIYAAVYNADKYVYNRRKIPRDQLSDTCTLWSGEQFKMRINGLCDKVKTNTDALKRTRLDEYGKLIRIAKDMKQFYPTLFDFAALKLMEMAELTDPYPFSVPSSSLRPWREMIAEPVTELESKAASEILGLYADLLRFHADDPGPRIYRDLKRIEFIDRHAESSDEDATKTTTYQLLKKLYDETSMETEYSGYILFDLYHGIPALTSETVVEYTALRNAIDINLKRYPAFALNDDLKEIGKALVRPQINITVPDYVAPGKPFTLKAEVYNIRRPVLKIYSVKQCNQWGGVNWKNLATSRLVRTFHLEIDSTPPFVAKIDTTLTLDDYGIYTIVANLNNDDNSSRALPTFKCTSMMLHSVRTQYGYIEIVNDNLTGEPVEGAQIVKYTDRPKLTVNPLGLTDRNGVFNIGCNSKDLNSHIGARLGKDIYANREYLDQIGSRRPENYSASLATSLAIYHPGDTVEWSAILYQQAPLDNHILPGRKASVVLYDANNQPLDTINGITDSFGRICGRFALPSDGLTGNFRISVITDRYDGNGTVTAVRTSFIVSDYKLPDFKVIIDTPRPNTPEAGAATVKGRVVTYSGFPLPDAKFTATLTRVNSFFYWRGDSGSELMTTEGTTDSNGNFAIEYSPEMLASATHPDARYIVRIEALSPGGETQSEECSFMLANLYRVTTNAGDNIVVEPDGMANIDARIIDTDRKEVAGKIRFEFTRRNGSDKGKVTTLTIDAPATKINLSSIVSGTYAVKVLAADSSLNAKAAEFTATVYRNSDTLSPSDDLLWTPCSSTKIEGREIEILFATSKPRQNVTAILATTDTILSVKRLELKAGMHHYRDQLPEGWHKAGLILLTDYDLNSESAKIEFINAADIHNLLIERESFRDKLVPGSDEQWRFRVKVDSDSATAAAMILNMFDSALNKLAAFRQPRVYRLEPTLNLRLYFFHLGYSNFNFEDRIKYIRSPFATAPDWNLYDRGVYRGAGIIVTGYSRKMVKTEGMVDAVAEEKAVMYNVMDSGEVYSSDLSLSANKIMAEKDDEEVGDDDNESNRSEPGFSYRQAETPLAFFKPMLTTDNDGRLEFSFTVPNANTTWNFNAFAFTRDLLSADFTAEITANKPLMVSPNLPRFMRMGDNASIRAMVINNSDTTLTTTTVVEIFNPANARVVDTRSFTDTIAPGRAAIVTTDLAATFGPMIGYRVRSAANGFADGEQSVIEVLPSSSEVIESTAFYIPADSARMEMRLPAMPDSATVTLSYCDNPTWLVVTALPGLSLTEMSTPADAATAIFAAAIADGLMRDNPQIAEALRIWSDQGGSEGMLTSMLEKNADLKMMLLNATPWMADAASDTERMGRLALLFDRSRIKSTIERGVSQLEKLRTPSGGLKWIAQCDEPSLWATECALSPLGHLEALGMTPDNARLRRITTDAVRYADSKETETMRRYPDSDFLNYAFVRNRFRSIARSTAVEQLMARTINKAIAGWKKRSLFDKGLSAIILATNGHRGVAGQILESLNQYASTSPEKGMWWPKLNDTWCDRLNDLGITALLLEAYHTVDPQAPQIDPIRQWLILRKEAGNWGTSAPTTTVVADILLTSRKWIVKAGESAIRIDGKEVKPSVVEQFTGSLKADISTLNPSEATLTVDRSGASPAWGSVVSRFFAPTSEILPHKGEALEISKHLYKAVNTPTGTEWVDATDLKVGDRVLTELVIRVDRQLDYVAITDSRSACLEPVEQTPSPIRSEGIVFYRENRDTATNIFITRLHKGLYRISYELYVNNAGDFASGIATIQSQYAPQHSAHSAGRELKVGN